MKTLILILSLTILTACSAKKQTTVGTIVSIDRVTSGKACDFGSIVLQPSGTNLAGNLITISLDDLDDAKEATIAPYLNKKVMMKVTKSAGKCSDSTIEITEIQ